MKAVTGSEQQRMAQKLREILATYADAEDLINVGAIDKTSLCPCLCCRYLFDSEKIWR
jgi:flagellar biosynthesis/type III secretory pathway ATPase